MFSLGIRHVSTWQFLRQYHGTEISMRTLLRRLCELNLKLHNAASCNCSDAPLREVVRRKTAMSGVASAISKSGTTYE